MELVIGLVVILTALTLGAIVFLAPDAFRAHDPAIQRTSRSAALRLLGNRAADAAEQRMRSRRWTFATADELELAGVRMRVGSFVVVMTLLTAAVALVAAILAATSGLAIAWLLCAAVVISVPLLGRVYLARRTAQRRAKFADQLDDTLQLISSGLRAGHSLARAIDAVSREADSPTSEEFARVINENRLGRDLGEAIMRAAQRMRSDDLAWTSQAVNIHREVGGNLSEVLDHVAETIRERGQIRRQVSTLSAEGRVSANVLMALPVGVAVILSLVSPGYLKVFVTTPLGFVLLAVCVALFVIGALWMRAITRIRF